MKQGMRQQMPIRMMPTTRGRVFAWIEARVWPPRMTAVVEKPSLREDD
jgi:hypothetical protein